MIVRTPFFFLHTIHSLFIVIDTLTWSVVHIRLHILRFILLSLYVVYSLTRDLNISVIVVISICVQYYSHELPAARCVHSTAFALTASAPSSSPMRRSRSNHFLKNDL